LIFGSGAGTIARNQAAPQKFVIKTAKAAEGEVYPDRFFSSYALVLNCPSVAEKDTHSPLALAN